MTNPAAETKSIGLPAIALLSWFLQCRLDSFIVTGQLLPIYRDYSIKTVPSGRENSRPSIGTLQKLMPTPTQTATPHTTEPLYLSVSALRDNFCLDNKRLSITVKSRKLAV
jgi:hypothetical protein